MLPGLSSFMNLFVCRLRLTLLSIAWFLWLMFRFASDSRSIVFSLVRDRLGVGRTVYLLVLLVFLVRDCGWV